MWIFLISLDILLASPVLSYSSLKGEYVLGVAYFSMSPGFTEWAILWLLYSKNYYNKAFIIAVFQILS